MGVYGRLHGLLKPLSGRLASESTAILRPRSLEHPRRSDISARRAVRFKFLFKPVRAVSVGRVTPCSHLTAQVHKAFAWLSGHHLARSLPSRARLLRNLSANQRCSIHCGQHDLLRSRGEPHESQDKLFVLEAVYVKAWAAKI